MTEKTTTNYTKLAKYIATAAACRLALKVNKMSDEDREAAAICAERRHDAFFGALADRKVTDVRDAWDKEMKQAQIYIYNNIDRDRVFSLIAAELKDALDN